MVNINKGIAFGKRPDLTGGGLIRSMGGVSLAETARQLGISTFGVAQIVRRSERA